MAHPRSGREHTPAGVSETTHVSDPVSNDGSSGGARLFGGESDSRAALEEMGRGKLPLPPYPSRDVGRVVPPVKRTVNLRPRDHGPECDELRKRYPNLAAYLYDGSWDELNPRDPGKLTVVVKGGMVFVKLQCPTEGNESPQIGGTWEQAFEGLERFCANSDSHWIEMRFGTGCQKRRDLRKKEVDKRNATTDT